MDVENYFIQMQRAKDCIPLQNSHHHFRWRMSEFTLNKLLDEATKNCSINFKTQDIHTIFGIKVEVDNMMPDGVFHLYDQFKIENKSQGFGH